MIRRRYVFWLALLMGSPAFAAPQTADLGISKTDAIGAPSPYAGPGGRIVYTIVVVNRGPDPAVNVVFSDPLPAGTTFVSLYVSAAGWETSTPAAGQAGTVTSRIGALSSGADVVFILIVRVDTSVPGGSLIPNTATIRSSTTDPNPFNDAATVVTTLLNLPAQASVPALDGRGLMLMAAALTGVAILVLHRK